MKTRKDNTNYEFSYYFDIETSKIPFDLPKGFIRGDKDYIQAMYLCNLVEMNNTNGELTNSWFFRTFEDFEKHINSISNEESEIKIFSHNLSYEFSFLVRHFNASAITKGKEKTDYFGNIIHDSIIKSNREPLYIKFDNMPHASFIDSLALLSKSVKKLGEDLIKRGENLPKLEYNYEKIRLWSDELTQLDYDYNERDNVIVARSMWYFMQDNNYTFKQVPMTFTSNTKKNRAEYIRNNHKYKRTTQLYKLNEDLRNSYKSFDFYKMQLECYQGGFTSSNAKYTNMMISNVYSIDEKSAYPKMMATKRFPVFNEMGDEKYLTYYFQGDDAYYMFNVLGIKGNIKGFYGKFIITNIKLKFDDYLAPLSHAHCINKNYILRNNSKVINGKIHFAEEVIVALNNIDLEWLNLAYDYEVITCENLYVTKGDKMLREGEVHSLLKNFNIKENIDKEKNSIEYNLSKVFINAVYGTKVQRPLRDSYNLINGEIFASVFEDMNMNDQEEVYNNFLDGYNVNNNSQNFDILSDGIYVTSYARLELIKQMVHLHNEGYVTIYCDTDSLKFANKKDIETSISTPNVINKVNNDVLSIINLVNEVNSKIYNENKENPRFTSFKEHNNISDKEYDKICKLGTWEIESGYKDENGNFIVKGYDFFITLGAKKYAYIDGKGIHTTIAGCSKNVNKYIELYAENEDINYDVALSEVFRIGTRFNTDTSGRTISIYENRPRSYCHSLTYNNKPLATYGGIIIEPTTYVLGVSISDAQILGLDNEKEYIRTLTKDGELIYRWQEQTHEESEVI